MPDRLRKFHAQRNLFFFNSTSLRQLAVVQGFQGSIWVMFRFTAYGLHVAARFHRRRSRCESSHFHTIICSTARWRWLGLAGVGWGHWGWLGVDVKWCEMSCNGIASIHTTLLGRAKPPTQEGGGGSAARISRVKDSEARSVCG